MTATLQEPFMVTYSKAKPGEQQVAAKWAVPFDNALRDIELPNAPQAAHAAYASIGWHVVSNAYKYCPAYTILETFNVRRQNTNAVLAEWEDKTKDGLVITDRRSGIAYWLLPSISMWEAAISWFRRENGHDDLVLCFDRKENVWYAEVQKPDLTVWIGTDGTETAPGDGVATHYHIDKHPNAVMISGE